jgi:hypothetical protein
MACYEGAPSLVSAVLRLYCLLGGWGGVGVGVASSASSSLSKSPPMRSRSPIEMGPSLITSGSCFCNKSTHPQSAQPIR